jgi:hypothetical protein
MKGLTEKHGPGVPRPLYRQPYVEPSSKQLTQYHFWRRFLPPEGSLNLREGVWCAHDKAKGRNQSTGALIVKLACVWMVASSYNTHIYTSHLIPGATYVYNTLQIT